MVTTAISGLQCMLWSWKELSSSTAQSSAFISGALSSSGVPIFPPSQTVKPRAFNSSEMMVVVVVLPSEPVTATIRQGHTWKKASISEVMRAPRSFAATSSGLNGCRPGVRKITSSVRSVRYPSPSTSRQPDRSSSSAISGPSFSRLRASRAVTSHPASSSSRSNGRLLTPIPSTATRLPFKPSI